MYVSNLPATIVIPGWKGLTVINTIAYYNTELITTVKSFIVQTPGLQRLYRVYK